MSFFNLSEYEKKMLRQKIGISEKQYAFSIPNVHKNYMSICTCGGTCEGGCSEDCTGGCSGHWTLG